MIRLIHWNQDEASILAEKITAGGYRVDYKPFQPKEIKTLAGEPPDAIIISLSRLPSQGRDFAANLLQYRSLESTPFIFLDGDHEKAAGIRRLFPELLYTSSDELLETLRDALANPTRHDSKSVSAFEAYKTVSLAKKLGIKEGNVMRLVDAPVGFEKSIKGLPPGAILTRNRLGPGSSLTIWFVSSRKKLDSKIRIRIGALNAQEKLWMAWPKKESRHATDLSATIIRKAGLSNGLVDYKIVKIDDTWSGLLFAKRKIRT